MKYIYLVLNMVAPFAFGYWAIVTYETSPPLAIFEVLFIIAVVIKNKLWNYWYPRFIRQWLDDFDKE